MWEMYVIYVILHYMYIEKKPSEKHVRLLETGVTYFNAF